MLSMEHTSTPGPLKLQHTKVTQVTKLTQSSRIIRENWLGYTATRINDTVKTGKECYAMVYVNKSFLSVPTNKDHL
jgi:hypothetical protein